MCQKKLLRYRNSTCCLGFLPIRPCEPFRRGYLCTGVQIVGVKATNVDRPTSHAAVECDATLFCRMRVPSDWRQSSRGDFDLVLRGLRVERPEAVYKGVSRVVGEVKMPACWRGAEHPKNWGYLRGDYCILDRELGNMDPPEKVYRDKFKSQVLVHLVDIAGSERGLLNWPKVPTPQADAEASCAPVESIWSEPDHYEEITFAWEDSPEPADALGYSLITREEIDAAREQITCPREGMAVVREDTTYAREQITCAREEMADVREETTCAREQITCAQEEITCAREEITCAREGSVASSGASGHSSSDDEEVNQKVSRGGGGKSSPGVSGKASREVNRGVSEEVGDAADDSSELSELSDGDFADVVPEIIVISDDEHSEDEAGPATPGLVESESGNGCETGKGRKRSASAAGMDKREKARQHSMTAEPEAETDEDEPLAYRRRRAK